MRGLDWSNTSYTRTYRQDTASWKRLKWEAQAVYVLLVRHLDRAGCLGLDGLFPFEAVAEMTGVPESVCEAAVKRLVDAGFLVVHGDRLTDPEFLDREEATMSNAQRKREYRERRRSESLGEHFVPGKERNGPEEERPGTSGNVQERPGTPSLPSLPSLPSVPKELREREVVEATPAHSAEVAVLGDLLSGKDLATLSDLILGDPVPPSTKRSPRLNDEKAMKLERVHLLAHLWRSTKTASDGGDSAFELVREWRSRARSSARKKKLDSNWRSDVVALRAMLGAGKPGSLVYAALVKASLRGWMEFEWSFMDLSIEPSVIDAKVDGEFARFFDALPSMAKADRDAAQSLWLSLPDGDRQIERVMAWLFIAKKSVRWTEEAGKYISKASSIVEKKMWLDDPGVWVASREAVTRKPHQTRAPSAAPLNWRKDAATAATE